MHWQKLTADHLFPTLEHKSQEGTGLLQTADQRDVAMLASTEELTLSILTVLCGYGSHLVY